MSELNRMTGDFSPEERATLLAQFEQSGLDFRKFAQEHNINGNTFRNWLWLKENPNVKRGRYTAVERKKSVEAFLQSGLTGIEFAKTWGISDSSLSTWVKRYEEEGSDGLMDRRPGPDDKRLGMKVPRVVQNEIVELKKSKPEFGFTSIKNWLYRSRGVKVSRGSIRKTIKNEGLPLATKPKKKRRSSEKVRRFERARPMQLWQSDITQFTLGPASMRVYLTVFMDDHSRYIVGWRLQSRQTADLVLDAFKEAMVRFGRPEEVLTDQGRQYFAWRGKSDLEKLLEKENIKHVVSRAHHPQTLGKCERFWETVSNEFWTRAKPKDLEEARIRIKYFIDHYNHQRPHQGLNGMTPADRFFGVAEEVREIIEKTVAENSLRMSLEELPQPPAFLIGQVGDQRIAFHGKGGGFYLTNENLRGEENGNGESSRVSVSEYAISRANSGARNRSEASPPPSDGRESGAATSIELSADTGERVVGCGDDRRAWTGEADSGDDIKCVARDDNAGTSNSELELKTNQVLATEQSSGCRNDGGPSDSATRTNEAEGERDDGARRDHIFTQEST
jgi:transposase InsO family protein/transposase-like protein